ncbi:hypothetical protein OG596_26570 [Streptomyces sp. NBC_01102]|uniref:hypothetical protein n=1 Tax=Streptomyces sp. NBC_01102 TaxID=2903749 RepID=UPI003866DB8D|nr:hypothetical protein OG596_26570 [Streptomyces sp. NBC_01102]
MITICRRDWLAAAIQAEAAPVTTQRAAELLTTSPWPTSGRNTARKDLRALARRGFLAAAERNGRCIYTPTERSAA